MMRGSLWRLAFIDASAPGLELIDRESLLGIRLDFDEGLGIKLYTSIISFCNAGPHNHGWKGWMTLCLASTKNTHETYKIYINLKP